MQDVIDTAGQMSLTRKNVYHCWASIKVSQGSLFNAEGSAVRQAESVRTHRVYIRFRRDIDFTQAAWLYEERLQSGARWFKILAVRDCDESGNLLEADCRLVERGVLLQAPKDVPAPVLGVVAMPEGVML